MASRRRGPTLGRSRRVGAGRTEGPDGCWRDQVPSERGARTGSRGRGELGEQRGQRAAGRGVERKVGTRTSEITPATPIQALIGLDPPPGRPHRLLVRPPPAMFPAPKAPSCKAPIAPYRAPPGLGSQMARASPLAKRRRTPPQVRCRTPPRWFSDRRCRSNLAIIGNARTQWRPYRPSEDLKLLELEARSNGS
jgi:hypothetical protein